MVCRDIDTHFSQAGVHLSPGNRTEARPAGDCPANARDQPPEPEVRGVPVFPGGRVGFKSRLGRSDALEIDCADFRPIDGPHWLDGRLPYHIWLDRYV